MNTEDLLTSGERAKRSLRTAQALAMLAKQRKPELPRVKDCVVRLAAKQPAIAMALTLDYAKRHPLHERGEWLDYATELLEQYRLSVDANQQEADQARDYLAAQKKLWQQECERLERNRERLNLVAAGLLLALLLGVLAYTAYLFTQKKSAQSPSSTATTPSGPSQPTSK